MSEHKRKGKKVQASGGGTEKTRRGIILRACLAGGLACLMLLCATSCRARDLLDTPEGDQSFFENVAEAQATAHGGTATVELDDLSRVQTLTFRISPVSQDVYTISDRAEMQRILALLSGVTFTRLDDSAVGGGETGQAVTEAVRPVVSSGLVLSYTVGTRDTVGSFYVSPQGQVCWFTSDGKAVFLSEAGQADYATIIALCMGLDMDI